MVAPSGSLQLKPRELSTSEKLQFAEGICPSRFAPPGRRVRRRRRLLTARGVSECGERCLVKDTGLLPISLHRAAHFTVTKPPSNCTVSSCAQPVEQLMPRRYFSAFGSSGDSGTKRVHKSSVTCPLTVVRVVPARAVHALPFGGAVRLPLDDRVEAEAHAGGGEQRQQHCDAHGHGVL